MDLNVHYASTLVPHVHHRQLALVARTHSPKIYTMVHAIHAICQSAYPASITALKSALNANLHIGQMHVLYLVQVTVLTVNLTSSV
jgi:hypothetical protein